MQVVADGRHSIPTAMSISAGGLTRRVALPAIADSTVPGAVTDVPVQFAPLTGRQFVVTFTGVRDETAANYYSAGPLALPLGIAEIGIPGVEAAPVPSALPGTCTPSLLTIDGQPIDLAVEGSASGALDGSEMQVVPCGPDANGIALAAGSHVVETALGHTTTTGWNIDQLVLDSAAGGGAGVAPAVDGTTPTLGATASGAHPTVTVTSQHIDSEGARVGGATAPFELVLGQSINAGWQAVATPGAGARSGAHPVNLGPPALVDSFANGWAVTAPELRALGGPDFTVTLTWTPQREVWLALGASGATLLLCLLLAFLPERWRAPIRSRLPRWLRRTPSQGAGPGPMVRPQLVLLDPSADRHPGLRRAGLLGLVTGVVTAAVTSLEVGAIVALVVAAGLLIPNARRVASAGAVAFIVLGAGGVIFGQAAHHYLPGSNWAGSFVHAGNLIWIGIVLLLADAVIVSAGDRPPRPTPPANGAPSPPT
jgi:arabinofuranan 3-O-arabinosyltransferase